MATRLKLEVFDRDDAQSELDEAGVSVAVLEETRSAAYETGYAAGWEDSVNAQAADQTRVQTEVSRNLQELSFTYHEARSHVLHTLEPLLRDMVGKVLPDMARETLGMIVLDNLRPVAARLSDVPLTLTVNPASRAQIEQVLSADLDLPVTITEDETLSEGQVFLRFEDHEQRVDLDGVIEAIAEAVNNFFQLEQPQEKALG